MATNIATPILLLAEVGIKGTDGNALAGGLIFFRVPGTSGTSQAVYGDANKASILSQPVVLDGYGKATVYTDQPVDMDVQSPLGAEIRTISRATSTTASQVDVASAGFTGTLSTGAQGAGGKTTLAAIVNRAMTSTGGKDWKYLTAPGATERPIYTEFNDRGTNVKAYGAVGNNLADDTAAFTAAIAAIKAAGGGTLLVPAGNYKISSLLTVDFAGFCAIGLAIGATTITQSNASAGCFVSTGGTFSMDSIAFAAAGSNSQECIKCTGANYSRIDNVTVGDFNTGILLTNCNSFSIRNHKSIASAYGIRLLGTCQNVAIDNPNIATGTVSVSVGGTASYTTIVNPQLLVLQVLGTSYSTAVFGGYIPTMTIASGAARVRTFDCDITTLTDSSIAAITPAATITLNGRPYNVLAASGTAISTINVTNYTTGDTVTLVAAGAGTTTLTHSTAVGAPGNVFLLGTADMVMTGASSVTLQLRIASWIEISRMVV